jgi:ABC-type oligopeptide transport system ATPase subunit
MADRILIMHHGRAVEEGTAEQIFLHPQQPYTKELLSSLL